MRHIVRNCIVAGVLTACVVAPAAAQNLVVANARIIVRPGEIIERGSIVVTNGRISSVAPGNPANVPAGATRIDGTGTTVIAGFIDTHRHIMGGGGGANLAAWLKDQAPTRMMELLESGITTVQSGGDDNAGILELKQLIAGGQMKGPRIVASARVPTARLADEAAVRAAVQAAVKSGADSIAEVQYPAMVWPFKPTEQERKNLAAGIDEARKLGIEFQVHAVSDLALVDAVEFGARKLVHSVIFNFVTKDQAKKVAASGAQVSSITGFGVPNFNVFSQDNLPKFRDGKAWPEGIIDTQGVGQEAGLMPVNLRTLYDAGVEVSYATDTTFNAIAALAHELRGLQLVFSPTDLVKIMGPNSAKFISREKEIGTLEVGKFGDLLVLGGNPLDGYWNFLTAVVVAKEGKLMVDKRGQPDAGKPNVKFGF